MKLDTVEPEGWEKPRGYANGIAVAPGARLVFVSGQIAWDADQTLVGKGDFAAQFRQALANVVAVVEAAGGDPVQIASMTVYVKDKQAYLASTKKLGAIWRELVGRHYPSMTLVEVSDLLEKDALVEIQAVAAI